MGSFILLLAPLHSSPLLLVRALPPPALLVTAVPPLVAPAQPLPPRLATGCSSAHPFLHFYCSLPLRPPPVVDRPLFLPPRFLSCCAPPRLPRFLTDSAHPRPLHSLTSWEIRRPPPAPRDRSCCRPLASSDGRYS